MFLSSNPTNSHDITLLCPLDSQFLPGLSVFEFQHGSKWVKTFDITTLWLGKEASSFTGYFESHPANSCRHYQSCNLELSMESSLFLGWSMKENPHKNGQLLGGLEHFFMTFHSVGNFHPSQLTRSYFSEGLAAQNHQPDYHPIINHYEATINPQLTTIKHH